MLRILYHLKKKSCFQQIIRSVCLFPVYMTPMICLHVRRNKTFLIQFSDCFKVSVTVAYGSFGVLVLLFFGYESYRVNKFSLKEHDIAWQR